MFIHLGSFLENHAHFLTAEMGKVYTRYRTELLLQPYPLGRHIPIFAIYGSTLLLHAWHTMSISKLYSMASTLHMLGTAILPWQWQPWTVTVVRPSLGFTSMVKTVRPCFPFLLIYLQIKQV